MIFCAENIIAGRTKLLLFASGGSPLTIGKSFRAMIFALRTSLLAKPGYCYLPAAARR